MTKERTTSRNFVIDEACCLGKIEHMSYARDLINNHKDTLTSYIKSFKIYICFGKFLRRTHQTTGTFLHSDHSETLLRKYPPSC